MRLSGIFHNHSWKAGALVTGQRVLVIDGQSETKEVLKAVLEPRGLQVNHVRDNIGVQDNIGNEDVSPHLVVLHENSTAEHSNRTLFKNVPRVIIGTAVMPQKVDQNEQYLQHPFQYSELIQAIEQLLQ